MARRMEARDRDELALDDKLDVARTLTRLNHRMQARHELNDIDAAIKKAHQEEVNRGEVTSPVVPDAKSLLSLFGVAPPAITEGGKKAKSGNDGDASS